MNTITKRRIKKPIDALLPTKSWLSLPEACAYLDMSKNIFLSIAIKNSLSVSVIGAKKYYRITELEKLFENNILTNQQ